MNIMIDMMPLIATLVGAGLLAGFMAGLLGIGGGIITIPALFIVFETLEYDPDWRMHMAIATSLVIIIATNVSSVIAHNKKGSVDWKIIKSWWVMLAASTFIGATYAKHLKTEELVYVFVTLASLMAIKMLLPIDKWQLNNEVPKGAKGFIAPCLIGFFSALMGIGGGSFTVPYLTLNGVNIHRAVGTASLGGLVISVFGGLGYLIGGLNVDGLPDSNIGFVNIPAALIVAFAAALMAPIGAKTAHIMPRRALTFVFGVFLISATIRLYTSI